MAPPKARVDNSASIRSASKHKQRSANTSKKAALNPLGPSSGASLASSLSSLFSPAPHGKDAALASLLASTSKPSVSLTQTSGLQSLSSLTGPSDSKKPAASKQDTSSLAPLSNSSASRSNEEAKRSENTTKSGPLTAELSKPGHPSADTIDERKKASTDSKKKDDVIKKEPNASERPKDAISVPKANVQASVPAGRRPVFRPVLASATTVTWPEMPAAGSRTVFHTLLDVLGKPHIKTAVTHTMGRGSQQTPQIVAENLKASSQELATGNGAGSQMPEPCGAADSRSVLAGINSVTRALEKEISDRIAGFHSSLSANDKGKSKEASSTSQIKIIFVCRHNLSPVSLIAHLPMLVCTRNAVAAATTEAGSADDSGVLLFPLPSGSEDAVGKAMGLRRCAVLALTSEFPQVELQHLLIASSRETGSACHMRAEWLEKAVKVAAHASLKKHALLPDNPSEVENSTFPMTSTTIKFLRTTQPLDLNACKAIKKTKRKERSARWKKRKMQIQQEIKRLQKDVKHHELKSRKEKARSKAETFRSDPDPKLASTNMDET